MVYKFKDYEKSEVLRNHLNLGGSDNKSNRIDITSLYLTLNDKPWIGVMGEFHFSRYDRRFWYEELCKMKAGGITVVATYLFWNYHEEIEGQFDFSGDTDIRSFVEDCKKAGLDVVLRIGPWAHGECRNGGFPDWLLKKPYALRDNNEEYLAKTKTWYEKIYEQIAGLLYKDGGNIIAVQLENELVNKPEHLLMLKKIAIETGFVVPLYTVTGWNSAYGAKIPVSEVLPVFAAYPEAPWMGHTNKLPLSPHYIFDRTRNDSAVGVDLIKPADENGWRLPYEQYPFATCELGGGMQVTHHRRPIITGMDAYALSLVKLGCGNNLVGYYMYHGGTHKIGRLSTLQESKATGYPNDYPILSYDFQAPLSEFGEVREQYRLLNLIHMFTNDFGEILAPMEAVESVVKSKCDDASELRYIMRTDGRGGFVFINHYQRLLKLENVHNASIDTGVVRFPEINVSGDISFFIPFNMELSGNNLEYATAQPLCRVDNTYFFAAVAGIKPEYRFSDGKTFVPVAGLNSAFKINGIRVVTLTWEQAVYARKLAGKLYIGEDCDVYECDGKISAIQGGDYSYFYWAGSGFERKCEQRTFKHPKAVFEPINDEPFVPQYSEELNIGGERKRYWQKITVDGDEGFIEIKYSGDVAQIYANSELIADDYYYGVPWRVPARLLYNRECYLVVSELKDDFYREF